MLLATFLIAMTSQTAWAARPTFSSGNGTAEDPYQISSTTDLNQLATDVNSGTDNYQGEYFIVTQNITYDGTVNNFTPIGDSGHAFEGFFDGKGKTISGLNINLTTLCVGLFGNIGSTAIIKGVKLDNSTIKGQKFVGGIVGTGSNSSTVENCAVTSNVSVSGAEYCVGGIIGAYANVRGCTSAAAVSGSREVGGIIGCSNSSDNNTTIKCCLYTGNSITATNGYNGAIIGAKNDYTTLTDNYYTANLDCKGINGEDVKGARKAVVISAAEGVTITPKGDPETIEVTGITFYKSPSIYDHYTIIGYDNKLYAATTEAIKLYISYTVSEGYAFNAYYDGNSHALTDNHDGTYTLTMTDAAPTITATDVWGMAKGANGTSEATAYTITTPAGLDLLAKKVNEGNDCVNTYFKLGEDITYPHKADGETGANTEKNYTAIGNNNRYFRGHFNGNGKTISGIRIYSDYYNRGLFGVISYPAVVENVTLADTRITAGNESGCIVGKNVGGTIDNCHVTKTVTIKAITGSSYDPVNCLGGIVGHNYINSVDANQQTGVVSNCISEATFTKCDYGVGGIAGKNEGLLSGNFVVGATIPAAKYKSYGAIAGMNNNGTFTNNYYSACTVGGVANATNVGVGADISDNPIGDITANNGAIVDEWGLREGNDGSEAKPYTITTTAGLDLLAQKVNAGKEYKDTYFKLGDNITYPHLADDADGALTESNYTAIGNSNAFEGNFDGNGKTISGIRIYKGGKSFTDSYQGLFGCIGSYAEVKNVTLTDTRITAADITGGIVGAGFGKVADCHVTNTVKILAINENVLYHGGIVGSNSSSGTISGCISEATLTNVSGFNYGGIAGDNAGTLENNFVIGATIPAAEYNSHGAIVGQNTNGTLKNNYYTACTVAGTANATNAGCNGEDGGGARKAVAIGAAEGVTITPKGKATNYDVSGITAYADNKVLGYDSKLYSGEDEAVKFSIAYTAPDGYKFKNINLGEGVTVTASEDVYTLTVPTSDVTVDVDYEAITYAITYTGVDGATFSAGKTEKYTIETATFTLNNPSKEGYVFTGWTYTGQTTPTVTVTIDKGSTGDKAYIANWKKLLTNDNITVAKIADQTYTGSEIKPAITVKDGTTDITNQCDITFANNTNVGTATVTIKAKNASANYTGEITTTTFKITPKTVSKPTITLSGTSFEYTGSEIKPTVTVKDGETTIPAKEYTVSYSNNIEAGTATVTITDKEGGNYTVSGSETFEIFLKGDINGDKVVNVADIVKAINDGRSQKDIKEIEKIIMKK